MSLLDAHLREIELCSSTIADLPFAPAKQFTNALLNTPDITTLIRDTEAHERALFSLAPSSKLLSTGSTTNHDRKPNEKYRNPTRSTAVAAVLGGDMAERLRREKAGEGRSRRTTDLKGGEVDVELLLKGAERLCAVYSIPGATEKISRLRARHKKVKGSLEYYEGLVAEQNQQLKQMNRPSSRSSRHSEYEDDEDETPASTSAEELPVTAEDLKREEESVRELEAKKRTLEDRVTGMEKDLGGILR